MGGVVAPWARVRLMLLLVLCVAAAVAANREQKEEITWPEGDREPNPWGGRNPEPEGGRNPELEGGRNPDPEGGRNPDPEGGKNPDPEGGREKGQKICQNLPPGFDKLVQGVDITNLDLMPLRDDIVDDGWRYPVVGFTCNKNRKWKNVDVEYDMPDQVDLIKTIPKGRVTAKASLVKTSHEVKESLSAAVSLNVNYGIFAFSSSASYKSLQESLTQSERFVSTVAAYYWTHEVYVGQREGTSYLSEEVREALGRLEGPFEENPEPYMFFINKFGTHYFTKGQFGGCIKQTYETDKSYLTQKTEDDLSAQASVAFGETFEGKIEVNASSSTIDKSFTEKSKTTTNYFGGETNLLKKNALEEWQPTVNKRPYLLLGKVEPIYNLLKDDVQRAALKEATMQHLLRRYLSEMRRTLDYVPFEFNTQSLLNSISSLETAPILRKDDVMNLRSELVAPEWYTRDTKLCFDWQVPSDLPSSSPETCDGGRMPERCVATNALTPTYLDNTGWAEGKSGCEMRWGIMSRQPEPWFRDVQICYAMQGSFLSPCYCKGENCKTMKGTPLPTEKHADPYIEPQGRCVPVNEFTPWHWDSGMHFPSACMLSWSLKVPDSAPLWMRTMKLCFSFWPSVTSNDKSKAQCGPFKSSGSYCVIANKWTPIYHDKTVKDYKGGCNMRWGLEQTI